MSAPETGPEESEYRLLVKVVDVTRSVTVLVEVIEAAVTEGSTLLLDNEDEVIWGSAGLLLDRLEVLEL